MWRSIASSKLPWLEGVIKPDGFEQQKAALQSLPAHEHGHRQSCWDAVREA